MTEANIIRTQPANLNFLSPLNFKFQISTLPTVNFFLQNVTLPGTSLPTIESPTPFKVMPLPGDHIQQDELQIQFKIDEEMYNYFEALKWIRGLGFPVDFDQYRQLAKNSKVYSTGLLTIHTSKHNISIDILFTYLFPTSISSVPLQTTDTDVTYINCTMTFKYLDFTLNRIYKNESVT